MLKINTKMEEVKMGIWLPENCLVRLDEGWCKIQDYNFKIPLLYSDNGTIKSKYPKKLDKYHYKGEMLGCGKIMYKPSDSIINKEDMWFATKTYAHIEALPVQRKKYEGFLYRFEFNPIVSYTYKESKRSKYDLLFLKYIIL